jgi:hypothetical protein
MMQQCAECFTIGLLCGAMLATAAIVIAVACVYINRPRPPPAPPEHDSVLG